MSARHYQRWDRCQLRQHQLLIVCFTLLCATGLPLRYASSQTSQTLAIYLGGASVAGLVHRLAALGLIFSCFWHFSYLLGKWRLGVRECQMLPCKQDLFEFWGQMRYLLGLSDEEPRYGRWSWLEKFEYGALMWGNAVMIATGLILWFPVVSSRLVTSVGLDLSKVIHGYEALLAFLSIALWHMYHAHLRADVFPMNRMWLTGTLSEEEMAHHHPGELDAIRAREAAAEAEGTAAIWMDSEDESSATSLPAAAGAAAGGELPPDGAAAGDDGGHDSTGPG